MSIFKFLKIKHTTQTSIFLYVDMDISKCIEKTGRFHFQLIIEFISREGMRIGRS